MDIRNRTERGTRASARRGSVLLVSVLVATVLLVLGTAFARQVARADRELQARIDDKRALYLAEAALGESVTAWREGSSGAIASPDLPARLGAGVIWSEVVDLGGDRRMLRATGMAGGGRSALAAIVDIPEEDPLFQYTLLSHEQLNINSSVMVDSYVSLPDPDGAHDGSYESQVVNETNGYPHASMNGSVASNNGIMVNANAQVFGDATPGPGHTVGFGNGGYVSGSTEAATTIIEFPPIDVPDIPSDGSLIIPSNGSVTLPPGNHAFDALTIGNTASLLVQGPASIVVGNFTGDRDGRLQIDASAGPVTIYVEGFYTHINGFEAAPVAGSPMALAFMLTQAQDIAFPARAKIRGAYYAPNASMLFTNRNEAWGSFAARRIEMSNDMKFHYDEVLADYWNSDGSANTPLFPIEGWVRVAVEPRELLRDRRDPFALLGLSPGDLPAPADAWVP